MSKILDNLKFSRNFFKNKNYNAEPELNKALKIREEENDLWGQMQLRSFGGLF